MTNLLGINAYHGDSSACLVIDGRLVAAAEEERFRRIKHWAGFPSESVRYCLAEAGISLADIGHIAINSNPRSNLLRKIGYTLANSPDLSFVLNRIKNKRQRMDLESHLALTMSDQFFRGKVHAIDHHLAHLYSAFYVSSFEEAVTVSVDGFGDFSSGAWGVGRGHDIAVDGRVFFPHSLGIFYQALTQYLGFPCYGDEYKVMGLAPYGKPKYLREMREIVFLKDDGGYELNLQYFLHHKEKTEFEWQGGPPVFANLFSRELIELLGPKRDPNEELNQRHKDIAHSIQAMYEEAFFHLLNKLYKRYGLDAVTLAGGCAMNSVANGKVAKNTPFKKVYIQAAAGDAGGAIGAAFAAWNELVANKNYPQSSSASKAPSGRFRMSHAYWGPSFSNKEIGIVLKNSREVIEKEGCTVERVDDEGVLCGKTAQALAKGMVVGWFQGRMEWGPRALGNRSIVCDPRRADMKDILNTKIKRRESFRPFAPSVLREVVSEWFEQDGEVPFMMKVFQVRQQQRNKIPAVTHADGSGRLQTVSKATNPRYYRLIEAFGEMTGVPMVLNTSFNENEPVVCKPEEALDCFLRTKMDMLVMENYVVARSETSPLS
jgi:carbamoyltransferase